MSAVGHADLQELARQEMIANGFEPEFPPAAQAQLQSINAHPPAVAPGSEVRDLRGLLWSSIDNDTSRDLDQIEVAERLPDGSVRVLRRHRGRGRVRARAHAHRRSRRDRDDDRVHGRQELSDAAGGALDGRQLAARGRRQALPRHRDDRRSRRRRRRTAACIARSRGTRRSSPTARWARGSNRAAPRRRRSPRHPSCRRS